RFLDGDDEVRNFLLGGEAGGVGVGFFFLRIVVLGDGVVGVVEDGPDESHADGGLDGAGAGLARLGGGFLLYFADDFPLGGRALGGGGAFPFGPLGRLGLGPQGPSIHHTLCHITLLTGGRRLARLAAFRNAKRERLM